MEPASLDVSSHWASVVAAMKRVPQWIWRIAFFVVIVALAHSPWPWLLIPISAPFAVICVVTLVRIVWQTPRAFLDGLHGR